MTTIILRNDVALLTLAGLISSSSSSTSRAFSQLERLYKSVINFNLQRHHAPDINAFYFQSQIGPATFVQIVIRIQMFIALGFKRN